MSMSSARKRLQNPAYSVDECHLLNGYRFLGPDKFISSGEKRFSPDFSPEVENKAVFRGIIGLL